MAGLTEEELIEAVLGTPKKKSASTAEKAVEGIFDEMIYNRDRYAPKELEELAKAAKTLEEIKLAEEIRKPQEMSFWQKVGKACENPAVQTGLSFVAGILTIGAINKFEQDDAYSGSNNGFIKSIGSRWIR